MDLPPIDPRDPYDPTFDPTPYDKEELDYHYSNNLDGGIQKSQSDALKDMASKAASDAVDAFHKLKAFRDHLYGYDDPTGKRTIHLKDPNDMQFLPDPKDYGSPADFSMQPFSPDFTIPLNDHPDRKDKRRKIQRAKSGDTIIIIKKE